jgi:hypothetical protein
MGFSSLFYDRNRIRLSCESCRIRARLRVLRFASSGSSPRSRITDAPSSAEMISRAPAETQERDKVASRAEAE